MIKRTAFFVFLVCIFLGACVTLSQQGLRYNGPTLPDEPVSPTYRPAKGVTTVDSRMTMMLFMDMPGAPTEKFNVASAMIMTWELQHSGADRFCLKTDIEIENKASKEPPQRFHLGRLTYFFDKLGNMLDVNMSLAKAWKDSEKDSEMEEMGLLQDELVAALIKRIILLPRKKVYRVGETVDILKSKIPPAPIPGMDMEPVEIKTPLVFKRLSTYNGKRVMVITYNETFKKGSLRLKGTSYTLYDTENLCCLLSKEESVFKITFPNDYGIVIHHTITVTTKLAHEENKKPAL